MTARSGDGTTQDLATSESEEMYLITIAMKVEEGHEGPVPVPNIARALGVSRVSANEMVKKLASRGLVEYTRYKGVSLSPSGERIAQAVLRRRRLWSVFLSERLGLTPQAADTVACEFEHITPADVAQRLAEFLGDPRVSPQGKPIPAAPSQVVSGPTSATLDQIQVGRRVEVVSVNGDQAGRSFLAEQGIAPGALVTVLGVAEGGACLVETERGRVHIAGDLSRSVEVTPSA